MSSKPATPPASRVAVPGAPRLLVYVADPRQLEAGPGAARGSPTPPTAPDLSLDHSNADSQQHHLQLQLRNNLYSSQLDVNDHRSVSQVFQKTINGNDDVVYGMVDNNGTHKVDYYGIPQFLKNNSIKAENCKFDNNLVHNIVSVKRETTNSVKIEVGSSESYHNLVSDVDSSLYQMRCPPIGLEGSTPRLIPSVQAQRDISNDDTNIVPLDRSLDNEKDSSLAKGYERMNYQYLEHRVSQSVVNQSINLVSEQSGVNVECERRTFVPASDSVVLSVLPATTTPPTEVCLPRIVQAESPEAIIVPLGWRRIISGSSVLYISPSGTALSALSQLRDYLQTAGTCKCGLPCPLRPESAFSFDPKVASKPYQATTGAELAKLCNHKRKLLASLQARGQSPGTPPPQLDEQKVAGSGGGVAKKKMKKRTAFPGNMTVSQLMVQRERHDYKDGESHSVGPLRNCGQAYPSTFPVPLHPNEGDNTNKFDFQMQRNIAGAHYLTVNNGWINRPEAMNAGLSKQATPITAPVPQSIMGCNTQIIGVNTNLPKPGTANYKNTLPQSDLEVREDKKVFLDLQNPQSGHTPVKSEKDEESQIFCGLNQPLTPEVMQKINEQQQIFIQQNQKQIELAMKGFRSQICENPAQNPNKNQCQNTYISQGQLVIQNGAVMKTNPAKTPPWQVKRSDVPVVQAQGQSAKVQKAETPEYEESKVNSQDDVAGSSNVAIPQSNNFHSHPDPTVNQEIYSRVPPLSQHYVMNQPWPAAEANKKKPKGTKNTKKKGALIDNKNIGIGSNGVRNTGNKGKTLADLPNNHNIPSFMEDPNGYLAQQTVLLNNTISKQVGLNSSYDNNPYSSPNYSNIQEPVEKTNRSVRKMCDMNAYRGNGVSHPSPNTTPDSSVLSDKSIENAQCCKSCPKGTSLEQYENNSSRHNFIKHNIYANPIIKSPKNNFDDNPVSSTYVDRNNIVNDSPIQAGTVSTSNVCPMDNLQPPEPSPTPSNSSRSTDTPLSSSTQLSNCTFPVPSPAYSNPGSSRDNYNSNPSTPGSNQSYSYNSPGPPVSQIMSGTQMMHFISNHNVNKNFMEMDNISLIGVKSNLKNSNDAVIGEQKRRMLNMPGYCPPPHLGGGPIHTFVHANYLQNYVTTMASGFSVTRDTVTSVLAGKAHTATTSINASSANVIRTPPPPLSTSYAIPNNQPDPFINSVNLPTSYPLHIAGTTAQNMISKSPLEMVQNVIGNIPGPSDNNTGNATISQLGRKICSSGPSNQILISSTGQIMVSNNGTPMPPPPPKSSTVTTSLANVNGSNSSQVVVNPPTVVVNTLPTPFVIQPPMVAVDGQMIQQNTVLPQIVTGGIVQAGQANDSPRQIDIKSSQSFVQGVAMLSPESLKKKSKKRKGHATNITNVLQIAAPPQNANNIMIHSSPQHNTSPQFSPRGFQLSPNSNMTQSPMLQALTIVPGKSGTPAHIVMNGQSNTSNFSSQQIITNSPPSQQINLLQPVNLINNASGVMPNFQAFQQFIVPSLGGMMMTADGTAIIQDNSSGVPMQLQLQTVNGQNVLTPVQNPSVFAAGGNTGVVIRAQNQQAKIIQSQHSPGAQFLSPNNQVMMSSPNFNGQLSPLLANLSPTNVTFNTSPHQVRTSNVQTQEYIQTNQIAPGVMVPLSPKPVPISTSNNRNNPTFVQQNTTIVQQQTTLVSNNSHMSGTSRLGIDPNVLLSNTHKQITNQMKTRGFLDLSDQTNTMPQSIEHPKPEKAPFNAIIPDEMNEQEIRMEGDNYPKLSSEMNPMLQQMQQAGLAYSSHVRHSVSTQTLVNQQRGKSPNQQISGTSPPDTTTHSPLGALETSSSPRLYGARSFSTQGNYADTTTKSPEPADINSSAMVQCVSSSEQDMAESAWPTPPEYAAESESQNVMPNMMRQGRAHSQPGVESSEMRYNQTISVTSVNNQQSITITPTSYYDRANTYKRKNEFEMYRNDKIMRTNTYGMGVGPQDSKYEPSQADKQKLHRQFNAGENANVQKMYNLGAGNDYGPDIDNSVESAAKIGENKRPLASNGEGKTSLLTGESGLDAISGQCGVNSSEEKPESRPGRDNEAKRDPEGKDGKPSRDFCVDDLVWGPVKGYASWPGKLVAQCGSAWAVRWFGKVLPLGRVESSRLMTLTEGLEAHHAARTRHRKSRKLNTHLENAIQEAMAELDKSDATHTTHDEALVSDDVITGTPKKTKKMKKRPGLEKKKCTQVKVNQRNDANSRLRSSR